MIKYAHKFKQLQNHELEQGLYRTSDPGTQ
jgi:hypothetical protein